jgi:hypothetical protein
MDLTKNAAYSDKTPYELWQETEGVPIYGGHGIEDLSALAVAPWKRLGVRGAFINLVGSGRSCGSYVCEIPPKGEKQAATLSVRAAGLRGQRARRHHGLERRHEETNF